VSSQFLGSILPASNPEVTFHLLARGLVETHENAEMNKISVSQGRDMPRIMRRALALLSAECMATGAEDLGSSIHEFSVLATKPAQGWGIPTFSDPAFKLKDIVLIDPDFGVPTNDCIAIAEGVSTEIAAWEARHHKIIRDITDGFKRKSDDYYTRIREFIVRNPSVRYGILQTFISENLLAGSVNEITNLYRTVPISYLTNGQATRCARCGSFLYPERNTKLYPNGRCRIRQCALKYPTAKPGAVVSDPANWRMASNDVLAYWVGPGLDEIYIYDALYQAKRTVVLYPFGDAADVGLDGADVGIDVKTYESPIALAEKLGKTIGRLAKFRRRVIAIPDNKLSRNPRYLKQLAADYGAKKPALEFATVSDVIKEFTK